MKRSVPEPPEGTAPHGPRGERGETGPRGEPGQVVSKDHILAAVADKFQAIEKQLDLQLIRTGEIQAELDLQRQDNRELRAQVNQVHALLNQYLKAVPLQAATPDRVIDRE